MAPSGFLLAKRVVRAVITGLFRGGCGVVVMWGWIGILIMMVSVNYWPLLDIGMAAAALVGLFARITVAAVAVEWGRHCSFYPLIDIVPSVITTAACWGRLHIFFGQLVNLVVVVKVVIERIEGLLVVIMVRR